MNSSQNGYNQYLSIVEEFESNNLSRKLWLYCYISILFPREADGYLHLFPREAEGYILGFIPTPREGYILRFIPTAGSGREDFRVLSTHPVHTVQGDTQITRP